MGAEEGDRELRKRILREFERDERLRDVLVEVKGGRVTLAGIVDSYAKKLAARDAAHRGGVPELTDDIQVLLPGSTGRTDRELAAAVGRALEFDEFVPDRQIRFTVLRGRVSLEGEVQTVREREDAARVVRHLTGVKGIDNRIRVKGPAGQPPLARTVENHT